MERAQSTEFNAYGFKILYWDFLKKNLIFGHFSAIFQVYLFWIISTLFAKLVNIQVLQICITFIKILNICLENQELPGQFTTAFKTKCVSILTKQLQTQISDGHKSNMCDSIHIWVKSLVDLESSHDIFRVISSQG